MKGGDTLEEVVADSNPVLTEYPIGDLDLPTMSRYSNWSYRIFFSPEFNQINLQKISVCD